MVGVSGNQASRILKLESLGGVTFVHDSPGGQLVCKGDAVCTGARVQDKDIISYRDKQAGIGLRK